MLFVQLVKRLLVVALIAIIIYVVEENTFGQRLVNLEQFAFGSVVVRPSLSLLEILALEHFVEGQALARLLTSHFLE